MVDTDVHVILAMPAAMSTFVQSAFIYLGLTIYMDHILQREFSPKESWLFFLKVRQKHFTVFTVLLFGSCSKVKGKLNFNDALFTVLSKKVPGGN